MDKPGVGNETFHADNLERAGSFIPRLHVVAYELIRGGQPEGDGIKLLAAAGVNTIVNLRDEDMLIKGERRIAEAQGLRFISIPMEIFSYPSLSTFNQFIEAVANAEGKPVFVHCQHGQDRTGTMVAAYRVARQGWTAAASYAEMLDFGFHPGFQNLTEALFDYAQSFVTP